MSSVSFSPGRTQHAIRWKPCLFPKGSGKFSLAGELREEDHESGSSSGYRARSSQKREKDKGEKKEKWEIQEHGLSSLNEEPCRRLPFLQN